ncbi:MAG: DUF4157 domain-containing protein [Kofleriaceae bacterium]
MSERDRRRPSSEDAALPIQRRERAGGGRTTIDLAPRPQTAQSHGPTTGGPVAPFASGLLNTVQRRARPADDPFSLHIQRRVDGGAAAQDPTAVQAIAAQGVQGAGQALPHLDRIQQSFGPNHDVSGVQAHVGGQAATAATAIGATAYATGNSAAFASQPDLHTAAHEAAHVVQQRNGVSLYGGVGQAGDTYECHADAVADRVVAGQSAADLLATGPTGGKAHTSVQRKGDDALTAPFATESPRIDAMERIRQAAARARDLELRLKENKTTALAASAEIAVHLNRAQAAIAALAMPPGGDGTELDRDVHTQLNKLARSAFAIMRHAAPMGGSLAVAAALDGLRGAAAPIGWDLPASAEDAATRAVTDEPCEADLAHGIDPRNENGEHCYLSSEERMRSRDAISRAATRAGQDLKAVLDRHEAEIRSAIEADAKLAEFFTNIAIDATVDLATFGMGKAIAPSVKGLVKASVKDATADATKAATKSALREISQKVAKSAVTSFLKRPPVGRPNELEQGTDARTTTIGLTNALASTGDLQLDTLTQSLESLDDEALVKLEYALKEVNASNLDARLSPIIKAYRSQLAPAGETQVDYMRMGPARRTTKKIARVRGGTSRRPAYALVEYDEDVDPAARKMGRAVAAGASETVRQVRGERLLDDVARHQEQQWVDEPNISVRFIRWIESPSGADFESIADDKAIDVSPSKIEGLPLSTPHGDLSR